MTIKDPIFFFYTGVFQKSFHRETSSHLISVDMERLDARRRAIMYPGQIETNQI